jgi:hypothetical protein
VPTPTVSPTLTELLATFVSHFKRAIRQEMDVMRERKGSFDIAIAGGVVDESSEAAGGARYTYSVLAPNDKLVAGIECTLRTRGAEYLVRVERVDGSDVTLSSERTIDAGDGQGVLVIYPWFLYEKCSKSSTRSTRTNSQLNARWRSSASATPCPRVANLYVRTTH